MVSICNRIIEYSFYALFLLVPLVFTDKTSELFELNKMWLTWVLTIIIITSWFIKMVLERRFFFQRTPLDIPIGLFLLSQIISTIFSWDFHVSLWGYYSRFNGGLLSIISYVFLYYAFVTFVSEGVAKEEGLPTARNDREHWREGLLLTGPRFVKRVLLLSLISGLIVALWGLPSHFGYDPTCLLFRGTLDVSCWTADFIPRARIFSTLGQPAWLAAYLTILIPIAIAFAIKNSKSEVPSSKFRIWNLGFGILLLIALFYVDLLYTNTRSGFLSIWIALIFFFGAYVSRVTGDKQQTTRKSFLVIVSILLLITFVIGTPINQLRSFTLEGIGSHFQKIEAPKNPPVAPSPKPSQSVGSGGTESGSIRLNVWTGAINAWKQNPIFGTGVETFAFAYYKYKPASQNLTSEWNFLYNKAHNEYLNYLATTGIVGLGTYLGMIIMFLVLYIKYYVSSIKKGIHNTYYILLNTALVASYISILITNFFGFSVVITNIYLFMIPAFVFVLKGWIKTETINKKQEIRGLSPVSLTAIFFIIASCLFFLISLFRFWQADIAYALGYNLDRAGEYQQAYQHLHKAVELRGDEPVFKDELSINDAIIAVSLISQPESKNLDQATKDKRQTLASSLTQEAINTSNAIVSKYPNNAVFWKTRTRVFYTLSQVDSRYLPRALGAIEKGSLLAPNDANIWYNLGVLYGQNNNIKKGIDALEKTTKLKPDYRDAYYALGLYYHTASLDNDGKVVINEALNQKALAQMRYILENLSPTDPAAKEAIESWEKK